MDMSDHGKAGGGGARPITADDARSVTFTTVTYREGYDPSEVDAVMQRVAEALQAREAGRPFQHVLTVDELLGKRFAVTKFRGGYDQDQVDDLLDRVIVSLRPDLARSGPTPGSPGRGPVGAPPPVPPSRLWLAAGVAVSFVLGIAVYVLQRS